VHHRLQARATGIPLTDLLLAEANICSPHLRDNAAKSGLGINASVASLVVEAARPHYLGSPDDIHNQSKFISELRSRIGTDALDTTAFSRLLRGKENVATKDRIEHSLRETITMLLAGVAQNVPTTPRDGSKEAKRLIVDRMIRYFFDRPSPDPSYFEPHVRWLETIRCRAEACYYIRWLAQNWRNLTPNPQNLYIAMISGRSETPALEATPDTADALLAAAAAGFSLVYAVPERPSAGRASPALQQAEAFKAGLKTKLEALLSEPRRLPDPVKAVLLGGTCPHLDKLNQATTAIRRNPQFSVDQATEQVVAQIGGPNQRRDFAAWWSDNFHVAKLSLSKATRTRPQGTAQREDEFLHPFLRYFYIHLTNPLKGAADHIPQVLQLLITDDAGQETIVANVSPRSNGQCFRYFHSWWESFIESELHL
jgi:hypothetical protein